MSFLFLASNITFDAFLTIKVIRQQSTNLDSYFIDVSLAWRAVEGILQQFNIIHVNDGRPWPLLPGFVSMSGAQCSMDVM